MLSLGYKGIQPGMAAQPWTQEGKPQNKTSKKRAVTHDAHKLLLEEQESLHEAYPRTQRNAATAPLGNLA